MWLLHVWKRTKFPRQISHMQSTAQTRLCKNLCKLFGMSLPEPMLMSCRVSIHRDNPHRNQVSKGSMFDSVMRQCHSSWQSPSPFHELSSWHCFSCKVTRGSMLSFAWMAVCVVQFSHAHCAKSSRPFELFANENCELQNEAKWLREVRLKIPWRSHLSAEMNDASTWRIGVLVAWCVMTLFATTARVVRSITKHVLIRCNGPTDTTVTLCRPTSADDGSLLFWAMFFTVCEEQG